MYIWTEIGLLPVTYAILSSALLCANALMCLIDYSCESALRIILCLDCLAQCKSSYRQWDVMKWFLILFYCYIRKLSWNEIFYCSRNGFCYLISFFLLSHYSWTTRKSFIILFGVDWLVWLTIVTLKRKKWLNATQPKHYRFTGSQTRPLKATSRCKCLRCVYQRLPLNSQRPSFAPASGATFTLRMLFKRTERRQTDD